MGDSVLSGFRTRRSWKLGLLALLVLAFLVWIASESEAQAVSYSSEEIAFIQMLNSYRADNGLPPVLVSDLLSLAAERHSSDMGKYAFFSHDTVASDWFPAGSTPWDRMAACGYGFNTDRGENIAAGYPTASAVMAGWQGSPGHNSIMLTARYKVVGIALVTVSGSPYGSYWTADFGGYVDSTAHSPGGGTTTTSLPLTTTTTRATTTTTVRPTTTTTTVHAPPPTTTTTVHAPPPTTTTTTQLTTTTTVKQATTTTVAPTPTTTAPDRPVFSDVNSSTAYAQEIWRLADRGIISGFGNGTFGPELNVTRQQFAKMIVLTLGYDVPPVAACGFTDVPLLPNSPDPLYPRSYVAVCASEGITVGTGPYTFSPYDQITRAQLVTMVARAAGLPDPPPGYTPPFDDFSSVHYPWARRVAYWGLLDGLAGLGPGFDFWSPASRGEVCLLLSNLLEH